MQREHRTKWNVVHHCRLLSTHLRAHCLMFDYRGFGDSGWRYIGGDAGATTASGSSEPSVSSNERAWPSEVGMVRDARAVVDWLVQEGGVPVKRIVLWGHSLGAGVAAATAADLASRPPMAPPESSTVFSPLRLPHSANESPIGPS